MTEIKNKIVVENLSLQYSDGNESLHDITVNIPANANFIVHHKNLRYFFHFFSLIYQEHMSYALSKICAKSGETTYIFDIMDYFQKMCKNGSWAV